MTCPKKRCPFCDSGSIVRNGHYENGRQRLFCKICRHSFHVGVPAGTHNREKIWFDKWVIEGYSIRQLSEQSGRGQKKLRCIIDHWLRTTPSSFKTLEDVEHMIFDGTFLHRPVSIVALMDAKTNTVIAGKYDVRENSDSQLVAFFSPLRERGLNPVSCTTDGNPQAMRTIRLLWPDIAIQRCLVHIQRQGLSWCRAHPTRTDAKRLRDLFRMVTYIKTANERERFLEKLTTWEEEYGHLIAKQRGYGWVFSDLKRARSMLVRALPDMFHYLEDPNIPPTTNGLEGYFSRLKGHYRHHRGLSPEKRHMYFDWYFKLRSR